MSAPARPGTRGVVLAACLVTALVPLGSTSVAVALPRIGAALGAGTGGVVALVTGYLVVTAACQPVAGALGDRWGRRRSCLAGTAASGIAALLAAASPDLPVLVVLRCAQAACGALALVNAAAVLRVAVPAERRGRAFGAVGAAAIAAAAAGPALGGLATGLAGWRGAFLVTLPVAAAALPVAARALPPEVSGPAARTPFDLTGALLLLAVLGGGAALLSRAGSLPTAVVAAGAVLVAAGGAWFTAHERGTRTPVLDVRVLGIRTVSAAGLAVATGNAALYTALLVVPLLVGSAASVPLLLCLLVGAGVTALGGGRLADRWGRRRPAVLGGVLVAGAGAGLVWTDPGDDPVRAGVLLAGCGVGQGLAAAAVQVAGLEALPPERAGLASGVWSTCRYVGSIAGSSLLPTLVAGGSGAPAFVLVAVGGALSAAAAVALPTRRARVRPPPSG
ncbi:MFS transporter, DHA2 family, methylenomycin A resistance protein [Geodermatophilus dictyosporus]|uniref:MFS transporter, DHA2 family, methylenomycin A resistance protein n=1 Tax=Geodermatophilus dictyosporus TaxID=1523247 RepID=A0A1I5UWY3_9ACTN|nr:MFS transporter [Geodermatophilus dictyosporus]SFP99547.1 MFS transporter, DHA2 family, methylenomycin A resistance protein [Geodermatophilus dictyosporus]